MTNTAALASLSYDRLGSLYGIFNQQAFDATTSTGRTRAMNARGRVGEEASRRGAVIRRSWEGVYMCGPASHFEPIR